MMVKYHLTRWWITFTMVTMMILSDNLYNINFENHYIIIDFSWFIHTFCVSVIWSSSSPTISVSEIWCRLYMWAENHLRWKCHNSLVPGMFVMIVPHANFCKVVTSFFQFPSYTLGFGASEITHSLLAPSVIFAWSADLTDAWGHSKGHFGEVPLLLLCK